jgi:phenylacetate-CoA ligase
MSSELRLGMIESVGAAVVCATPTYALRLAEVADATRHDGWLAGLGVRAIIVAGEPGGSIPATRQLIERRWGARVIDHHGLTEVGPVSFECWERPGGLHVNEAEFVAEVIDPARATPVPDGTMGELVLTNLGRTASPVLRYRTGDLVVRRRGVCACGRTLAWLDGGILARADDMVTVRGVNVYPAAIEAVLRQIDGIAEFRSTVAREGAMRTLSIEIELDPAAVAPDAVRERAARELQGRHPRLRPGRGQPDRGGDPGRTPGRAARVPGRTGLMADGVFHLDGDEVRRILERLAGRRLADGGRAVPTPSALIDGPGELPVEW